MDGYGRRRPPFEDRRDAADRLAAAVAVALGSAGDRFPAPVVLGLPRGGVVLAAEVALTLGAPLDVLVVRKLGHPRRPELGLGAIAEDGVRVLNDDLVTRLGVTDDELDAVTSVERAELGRRVALYRSGLRQPLAGATAVIVDDGLATGYTALAALQSARSRGAARAVLAVPVGAREAVALLRPAVDELVCLVVPGAFGAVGQAYRTFGQVLDEEVVATLARFRPAGARRGIPGGGASD